MKKVFILIFVTLFIFLMFFIVKPKNNEVKYLRETDNEKHTDRIPVLTFHRLVPDDVKKEIYPDNQWVGSIDVFEEMIKYLYDNGYKTISTEEFYEWYIGNVEYDKKTVLITFDDGFYEDYYLAYPILKRYDFKATSFLVGSRIKNITDKYDKYSTSFVGMDVIKKVREEYPNFEFQSHSYNMHYYTLNKKHRIRTMSYEELENDTIKNEQFEFNTMAYPYGDYNKDIEEILENHGYLVAFKFGTQEYATRNADRYAIPRIKLNGNATVGTLKKWLNY